MTTDNIISTDKNKHSHEDKRIQVGLSACLAGQKVRYNAGHTQSRLCLDILSKHFSFNTFCPEAEAGFGIPRPTMRLTGNPAAPTLIESDGDGSDLTSQLVKGFENKLPEFGELDGYILMKNSPSCGLERVKVYQANGHPHQTPGVGIFARALKEKYPLMPIEEEGRLHDDLLYDNFITRVYAYSNFRQEVLHEPSLNKLMEFHASYKYILMSHHQKNYKRLGQIVASHKEKAPLENRIREYFELFMQTLTKPANRKNHTNTLLHLLGYLKKSLPVDARRNIVDVIYKYKDGMTPLTTPLTLLSHYLGQYGSSYIKKQRYLQPYPESIHPIRKYCP